MLPLSRLTATLAQQDWCSPHTAIGLLQAPLLESAAGSGQLLVPTSPFINATGFEVAFYRRGAPLNTAAQRRAAVAACPTAER